MSWKNLTVLKKLSLGFGFVVLLSTVIGVFSFQGIGDLVDDATEVISGNKLDSILAAREVDHLNWANKVNALLTDERVTELDVQLDDYLCAFGKWLYGDGRLQAEALVPSLIPIFKKIEAPHAELHRSAQKIKDTFSVVDLKLPEFLTAKEVDHLKWSGKVQTFFLEKLPQLKVATDDQKCSLGTFIYGDKGAQTAASDQEMALLLEAIKEPHGRLHASVAKIQNAWQPDSPAAAYSIYETDTLPALHATQTALGDMKQRANILINEMNEANRIYATQTVPNLQTVQQLLAQLRTDAKKHIITDTAMLETARKTRRNVIIVSLLSVIVGIGLSLLVAQSISKPIIRSAAFSEIIAAGDFSNTLEIQQKDEIGALATSLNNIVSNLGKMFRDIKAEAKGLAESSNVLSSISSEMSFGAEHTNGKSDTVAAAAEELSANSNSVAAATEQAATNVNMVAAAAEEMSATIGEIADNTKKTNLMTMDAADQASNASQKVAELGSAAQEITKVTEVITEISEQTNLLALNATIEAARAGEAGKGFAVVANEIKDLAKQTSEATAEIKEKIANVQATTERTVTEITQVSQVINEVSGMAATVATAVDEQSATTREIAENIAQASQGLQEVTENVAQTSAVSDEIASDIAEVSQSATKLTSNSGEIQTCSGDLRTLSVSLTEMVDKFKI